MNQARTVTTPAHSRGYYRMRTVARLVASLCAGSIALLAGFLVGAAISQTQKTLTHIIQIQLNQGAVASPQAQFLEVMTDPYVSDYYSRVGDHNLPIRFAYSPMTQMFVVNLDNENHPASHLVSAGIICGNETRDITVDNTGIAVFEHTTWPCEGLVASISDGTNQYLAKISLTATKDERPIAESQPSGGDL